MSLLLHPLAEHTVKQLTNELPQGLLLTGVPGVGLATIARMLASDALEVFVSPKNKDGEIDQANGTISIDETRKIYEMTRSKSLHDRVVIIDDLDRMTLPAQNAFLKLLEEPPAGVHFIATTHSVNTLLPTIRSRVQTIHIPQISAEQSRGQIDSININSNEQSQLLFMAVGRPAEMQRLLSDTSYRRKEQQKFSAAKTFVGGSSYQKLLVIQSIKSRTEALQFVTSCIAIIRGTLTRTTHASLVTQLDSLLITRERIAANGNVKLQLLRACL